MQDVACPERTVPYRRHDPAGARDILGVQVLSLTRDAAVSLVLSGVRARRFERYAFLNAHGSNLARRDAGFGALLARFQVLPDGFGVDIASRMLHGSPFPANLNGTDFVPALLAAAPAGTAIGLLGASPGVADKAVARLSVQYPELAIETVHHGFFDAPTRVALLEQLSSHPVDILLVAFGNPQQETFIDAYVTGAHAHAVLGVGALFDFLSQEVPRAPKLMRRLRAEWIFRLAREPRRLWKRYLIGNPFFLARVAYAILKR